MGRPRPGLRLDRLAAAAAGLFFPPVCVACSRPPAAGAVLCDACREQTLFLTQDPCRRCGRPLGPGRAGRTCPECRDRPPAFDRARAVAVHAGPLAEALRRFKYHRRLSLGPRLAGLLAAGAPDGLLDSADLVAPVPLHPRRLARRGFNQALILASGLKRPGGPRLVRDLLLRRRHTRPQVGLDPAQRRANVAGAFGVNPKRAAVVESARVLLVDDVYTTGATAGECARVLGASGAAGVDVLTLARAVEPA